MKHYDDYQKVVVALLKITEEFISGKKVIEELDGEVRMNRAILKAQLNNLYFNKK